MWGGRDWKGAEEVEGGTDNRSLLLSCSPSHHILIGLFSLCHPCFSLARTDTPKTRRCHAQEHGHSGHPAPRSDRPPPPAQVDLGQYSKDKLGVSIPRGWDQAPRFTTRTDLVHFRRKDAIPPPPGGGDSWGDPSGMADRLQKFATLRPLTAPIGLDEARWVFRSSQPQRLAG